MPSNVDVIAGTCAGKRGAAARDGRGSKVARRAGTFIDLTGDDE